LSELRSRCSRRRWRTTAPRGANAEHAHIIDLIDALVSTDENRTYKPDPRAYQLGTERLRLAKSDIVFAAFGGWDAVGAKSFGYPTFWVNRANQPAEQLTRRPPRIRVASGQGRASLGSTRVTPRNFLNAGRH
jgi:FMN phosphatase YigB (HAD superfamily)